MGAELRWLRVRCQAHAPTTVSRVLCHVCRGHHNMTRPKGGETNLMNLVPTMHNFPWVPSLRISMPPNVVNKLGNTLVRRQRLGTLPAPTCPHISFARIYAGYGRVGHVSDTYTRERHRSASGNDLYKSPSLLLHLPPPGGKQRANRLIQAPPSRRTTVSPIQPKTRTS